MGKKELTQEQKDRIVKHWQERVDKEFEESKKRIALLENPATTKVASELSHRLVQCCLDYINETGDTNIYRVNFTADCLQESAKQGKWCPCTDAACDVEDEKGNTISYSI